MPIRPHLTIVVLETDPIHLRSITETLRREGYDVYEAATPAEARFIVDHLRKPIALLLCDFDSYEIHGRDAADVLQALRPEMRVLFMSPGDNVQFRQGPEPTEPQYLKDSFDSRRLLELVSLKLEGWKRAANQ